MSGIDIAAWLLLAVLAIAGTIVALTLAALPGRIARGRNHPSAQAVNVAGWVTFFTGFVLWPIALIWAYVDLPSVANRGAVP